MRHKLLFTISRHAGILEWDGARSQCYYLLWNAAGPSTLTGSWLTIYGDAIVGIHHLLTIKAKDLHRKVGYTVEIALTLWTHNRNAWGWCDDLNRSRHKFCSFPSSTHPNHMCQPPRNTCALHSNLGLSTADTVNVIGLPYRYLYRIIACGEISFLSHRHAQVHI